MNICIKYINIVLFYFMINLQILSDQLLQNMQSIKSNYIQN